MRICIDSNQFIFGISGSDPACETLMLILPNLDVVLPRLIVKEVTRNLNPTQVKQLYRLFNKAPLLRIIDDIVPIEMVLKYKSLGLPEKADAFIAAFVEWQRALFLISDNRHFLTDLHPLAFQVMRPEEFIHQYYKTCTSTGNSEFP